MVIRKRKGQTIMNKEYRVKLIIALLRIISLFITFMKASVNFESHWPARTDLLTGSLNFSLSTRTLVVHCHPRSKRVGEGQFRKETQLFITKDTASIGSQHKYLKCIRRTVVTTCASFTWLIFCRQFAGNGTRLLNEFFRNFDRCIAHMTNRSMNMNL